MNNQNYTIWGNNISFPVIMDGKVQRLVVSALLSDRERDMLRMGSLDFCALFKNQRNGLFKFQSKEEPSKPQVKKSWELI